MPASEVSMMNSIFSFQFTGGVRIGLRKRVYTNYHRDPRTVEQSVIKYGNYFIKYTNHIVKTALYLRNTRSDLLLKPIHYSLKTLKKFRLYNSYYFYNK